MRFSLGAPSMALATLVAVTAAAASPAGGTPPLASLRQLPPPTTLPADYVREVGRTATHVGITRATAVKRTRLLLSDVTGLPLYAFGGRKGQVCFLVWRGVGTCGALDSRSETLWAINGGSRRRGQAVVGLVSDRVRSVTVTLNGKTIPVRFRHNAFVAPFRISGQTEPRVTVTTTLR